MKKHQKLVIAELVQEIGLLIDDWYFTKCPHDDISPIYKDCYNCPHLNCVNVC